MMSLITVGEGPVGFYRCPQFRQLAEVTLHRWLLDTAAELARPGDAQIFANSTIGLGPLITSITSACSQLRVGILMVALGRPANPTTTALVIRLVDGPRTRLADSKIDVAFLGWPTHNNHPMIKTFGTHDSQLLHSAATAGQNGGRSTPA